MNAPLNHITYDLLNQLQQLVDVRVWPNVTILPIARIIFSCIGCLDFHQRETQLQRGLGMSADCLHQLLVDLANSQTI